VPVVLAILVRSDAIKKRWAVPTHHMERTEQPTGDSAADDFDEEISDLQD
jgi:hypothetical protein